MIRWRRTPTKAERYAIAYIRMLAVIFSGQRGLRERQQGTNEKLFTIRTLCYLHSLDFKICN